jgi:hypothetical protein
MTPPDDDLRAAVRAKAQSDVDELLADVRAQALRTARMHLVDLYVAELMSAARRTLAPPAPRPTTDRPSPASSSTTTGAGCYLYAVVDGDGTGVTGLQGIEPGGTVGVVTVGDISAVVSNVDTDAMREGGARAELTEDSWLVRAIRTHEQVVLAAFRSAPTVPMRFGIVHADRAAVEGLLTTYGDQLREELARIDRAAEWSVKLFADREQIAARLGVGATSDVVGGRDYLLRERARRELDTRVGDAIGESVERLTERLSTVAKDIVPIPIGAGEERRPVFSAVCLVDRADEQQLAALVETFCDAEAGESVTAELAGPWPPYHFTSLRLESADG